jgi:hypothetical protein
MTKIKPLTPTMKHHLKELAAIYKDDYAGWGPMTPGEWACARALADRGLLIRDVSRGAGRPFRLSVEGYDVGSRLP